MEAFSEKTEVSFSQLFKKDGWFARLVVFHLVMSPIYTLIFYVFRQIRIIRSAPNIAAPYVEQGATVLIGLIIMAPHLVIGFLLWKKRTRSTITVSIVLLWVVFVVKRVFASLIWVMLFFAPRLSTAAEVPIMNQIYKAIYVISFSVLFLALTIAWTRNLKRLRSLYP